jgi:chemotaxis protein CheD
MTVAGALRKFDLQPGQIHLARGPMLLQTILGSCVAVSFWSDRLGVGALCHGVLPQCPLDWPPDTPVSEGFRYVDFSIRYLARKFDALGARRSDIQVKLFGGADVLPVLSPAGARLTVGAQNSRIALEIVEAEGFHVLARDLGGNRGRKIHFDTRTGEVLVYKLAAWTVPEKEIVRL